MFLMFGKHWKHGGNWPQWEERRQKAHRWGWRRPKYNIPVNIIEHDTEFEVRVHALTFPKDQIKISVVEDMLYISGTREPEGDPHPNFVLQEYPIKSFERSFELSHRVDKDQIKAKHEDGGVLVITVPKTSEAQTSDIEIEVE